MNVKVENVTCCKSHVFNPMYLRTLMRWRPLKQLRMATGQSLWAQACAAILPVCHLYDDRATEAAAVTLYKWTLRFPVFVFMVNVCVLSLQRSCCLLMWLTPTRGVCGRPEIEDLWRTSRCIASWRRWLQKHWMSSRTTLRGLKRRRKRYCGYIVFMSSLWQSWWWPAFLENWRNSNTAGRKSRGKQKVGKSCIIFFRKKVALCSTLLYVHYCTGFCDGPN